MRDIPIPTPQDMPQFLGLANRFKHNPGALRMALVALVARGMSLDDPLDGQTPLYQAVMSRHDWLVQGLLDAGADPMAPHGNRPAFRHAVAWNETAAVLAMLATGRVDVHHADEQGSTAFHDAAVNGNVALMEALLAAGADALEPNVSGETALDVFARTHGSHAVEQWRNRAQATLSALEPPARANRFEKAWRPKPGRRRLRL